MEREGGKVKAKDEKNVSCIEVTNTRRLDHNGSEESVQQLHAWVIITHGN